ncbi:4-(cytidine 5'-diphospho)-2-C-methyl-D-erythritol kinase [Paracoccus sp. p3-h83]|uniref:4-(cytidine 5'-diphospho)-2-C-methyl-D-erythritol kinase n=1 Tax=Paracoccus sp. p3-h83 TaxID=3342805 RepID=UPI0035B985EA
MPIDAPAKVNLTLHVTGRRGDGYHLLDSLVVFAGIGDEIAVAPGDGLTVTGPFAGQVPGGKDNLVMQAAALMGGAAVRLVKNLPVASGVGGGSSDAAAVLRALAGQGRALPDAAAVLSLGADVPVCLAAPQPMRMAGIGEVLTPVTGLARAHLVLVNPGVAVPTGAVFGALARRDNPPMPDALPDLSDARRLADFLLSCRNDLEPPARRIAPAVDTVLGALAASDGCLIARMSGSGATCFGVYATADAAAAAAQGLRAAQPGWWVQDAPILGAGSR